MRYAKFTFDHYYQAMVKYNTALLYKHKVCKPFLDYGVGWCVVSEINNMSKRAEPITPYEAHLYLSGNHEKQLATKHLTE